MDTSALIIGDRRKRQIQGSWNHESHYKSPCSAPGASATSMRAILRRIRPRRSNTSSTRRPPRPNRWRAPARVGQRWEGDRKRIFDAAAARAQAAAAGAAIYFFLVLAVSIDKLDQKAAGQPNF